MVRWEDITDGPIRETIEVTITDAVYHGGDHLQWDLQVALEDKLEDLTFQIWTEHDVDTTWKEDHRYRLEEARGDHWDDGHGRKLHSTSRLSVTHLGPAGGSAHSQVLVIGDTHIGYENRESGKIRWHNELDCGFAFFQAIKIGIRHSVDAVVHAGDVFDHTVTSDELALVDNILDQLGEAEIPFYYVEGNHETESGVTALEDHPVATHLSSTVEAPSDGDVLLYGHDNVGPEAFPREGNDYASELDAIIHNPDAIICIVHQTLSDVHHSGEADLGLLLDQPHTRFDYVVSGHLHDAVHYDTADPEVLYTGSTEHLSKKGYETEPSAWILEIGDEEIITTRHPID